MLRQRISIAFVAALLVGHGISEELQCPKGCSCKEQSMDLFFTMTCKSLNIKDKPSVHIANFEIFQSEQPIQMFENVFSSIGLEKLNTITISNSSIFSIDKNAFKELAELSSIKIMHTNISYIHPDTFKHNLKLDKLYLHNNPLKHVNINSLSLHELIVSHCNLSDIGIDMFDNVYGLEMLDMHGNYIKKLVSGTFDSLTVITEIHLENNQISHLPEDIFQQNNELEVLYLDNNPITTVPALIVPGLDTFSLRLCQIHSLEDKSFERYETLNSLDLSDNQISKISTKALYNLKELVTINLSGNDIHQIDEHVFYNNLHLEKILLDNNKNLQLLPKNGFRNKDSLPAFNVYYFSCQNCGLDTLFEKTFSTMPGLITLILSKNKIPDIKTGVFTHLKDLYELDLSYNQIVSIDNETFKNNINLNTLNLAGNPLKTLHPSIFKHNSNLQNLNLHSCGLHSLWTGPKIDGPRLSSIQNLNISDNKITLIAKEDIEITDHLKSLDISGNVLPCSEGYKTLVEYLTDKEIQDTEYRTHEEMTIDKDGDETIEEMDASMGIWKEKAKIKCPGLNFVTKYIHDKDIDGKDIDGTVKSKLDETNDDEETNDNESDDDDEDDDEYDEDEDEEDEDIDQDTIVLPIRARYEKYSYLWLTLIFLGVLLVTLGVVANLILFIIKRRQMIEVPRINIRHISKLKKNSGLVYQQLSEERDGIKTPVLSRFMPIPSVHAPKPNPPQFV